MAPLLHLTVQILSYIPFYSHEPSKKTLPKANSPAVQGQYRPNLSAISWGKGRQDIFGTSSDGNLTHKWYDGSQWQPAGPAMESLGPLQGNPPTAVSWGDGRIDICTVGNKGDLLHTYYDSHGDNAWLPSYDSFETLSSSESGLRTDYPVTATSWDVGRLDIFTLGQTGDVMLKYFDGSNWGPENGQLENLGGNCDSFPVAVSWGPNRNDIFCTSQSTCISHKYWDGSQWSNWEELTDASENTTSFTNAPTVISWGTNRLDVFAINQDSELWHKLWDGSQWLDWEILGNNLVGSVAANSWSQGRIDIIAQGTDGSYVSPFFHEYDKLHGSVLIR